MRRSLATCVAAALTAAACGGGGKAGGPVTLTLVAYDSFTPPASVWKTFERRSGIRVKVLLDGDGGEIVNKAVLTKDAPLGDVLFGVDSTFLSRAVHAGIFAPHRSPLLPKLRADVRELVPGHEATPVDVSDVCVNTDKTAFAKLGLAPPTTLDELAEPRYRGQLVVENPATASPGLTFMLATRARYGDRWLDYWKRLRTNGVKVVDGWTRAYEGEFSAGGGKGTHPLVVSYASSPPAAVLFSDHPDATTTPVGVLDDSCFRVAEFAGVLAGTKHADEAGKLVDFLAGRTFQQAMPLALFVFPVNEQAVLPPLFRRFARLPSHPLSIPPAQIEANRDRWIRQWTDTVLR